MSTTPLAGERVAVVGPLLGLRRQDLWKSIEIAGGRRDDSPDTATVVATFDPNEPLALAPYRHQKTPILREALFEAWLFGVRFREDVLAEASMESQGPLAGARVAFAFVPRPGIDRAFLEKVAWNTGATPLQRLTEPNVRRGGRFLMVRDPSDLVENRSARIAAAHGIESMTVDRFLAIGRAWRSQNRQQATPPVHSPLAPSSMPNPLSLLVTQGPCIPSPFDPGF